MEIPRSCSVGGPSTSTRSSTPISPRRSPRLALSPISAKPSTVSCKRKRGHTKSPKAKRRLIADDSQGTTIFGTIISGLKEDLTYNVRTYEGTTCLEITRIEADIGINNGGPLTGAKITILDTGLAYFQAHNGPRDYIEGNVFEEQNLLDRILGMLGKGWHYCCGIPMNIYKEHSQNVRYEPEHYNEETQPVHTVRADSCKRWFYVQRPKKNTFTGLLSCPGCNAFFKRVRCLNKRNDIPISSKVARLDVSSKYQYKFLSPLSAKRRRSKVRTQRKINKQRICRLNAQLEKTKLSLEESQNAEMLDVVTIINQKYQDDLENIWAEAGEESSTETMDLLKEIWEKDTSDRNDFYLDQKKNITGKKSNKWSTITFRIALAIYSRSPAAYEALKSFKILQLPSVSSLKTLKGARFHQPGINDGIKQYIKEQQHNYMKYKEEVIRRGQKEPLNQGLLIFDEVKVTSKVKWSSSGQKFFGLALSYEDFGGLHDVYDDINPNHDPVPAEYNLQFLWRDLTSDFDVVGPYFSSAKSYHHRFVIAAIRETMRLFHACNFLVVGLVCDGASTNLAAIKLMCLHRRGTFGTNPEHADKHMVKPWFRNYFYPTLNVYCCICPSHQLKNMVNALYQSRATAAGTKLFKLTENSPYFGWQIIKDMYTREETRRDRGQLTMVPGLLRSHIDRDPWTKLAVFPAKIMQVCDPKTAIPISTIMIINIASWCKRFYLKKWHQFVGGISKIIPLMEIFQFDLVTYSFYTKVQFINQH